MADTAQATFEQLRVLIGLKLSGTGRACDMRMFDFGELRPYEKGECGQYALHVQCPWRIETADRILTGRHDLFHPAEETDEFDADAWDWTENETLQDRKVRQFIETACPTVEDVATDAHGGAVMQLSGTYRLVLFPAGTQGEDWRLFRPASEKRHFVVRGGRVEEEA
ncbi:MAG: hypothetical protein JW888_00715 [Pirellulales bacterium]|nr:hypothetical protein [Pirellulales bacterium]